MGCGVLDIDRALSALFDADLLEEIGDVTACNSEVGRYCSFVLRGEKCPLGLRCHLRHFSSDQEGSQALQADDVERAALTCGLCGQIFSVPVTLVCWHTFD